MDDDPSKFIYRCPECHSFQFSDIATCFKCGSPSPNRKDDGDSQAGIYYAQLADFLPDQPRDSGWRSNANLRNDTDAKARKAAVQGGKSANDPSKLFRRVRIIGWWQVLAAVLIFLAGVTTLDSLRGSSLWSWMPIFVVVVGVNAVAGIQTLRRRRVGYWLSIWNHVAQIPVIAFPGLTFTYFGLGGVVGYLSFQRLAINDQIFKFGLEAEFQPGFEIMLGGTREFYKVGIDLLAIGFVAVLLSALRLNKTGG